VNLRPLTWSIDIDVDAARLGVTDDKVYDWFNSGCPKLGSTFGKVWFQNYSTMVFLDPTAPLKPNSSLADTKIMARIDDTTSDATPIRCELWPGPVVRVTVNGDAVYGSSLTSSFELSGLQVAVLSGFGTPKLLALDFPTGAKSLFIDLEPLRDSDGDVWGVATIDPDDLQSLFRTNQTRKVGSSPPSQLRVPQK
jgi:hypothetical protein